MGTNIQSHFNEIHVEILRRIRHARYSIKVAVAWLTDFEILNALIAKAKEGLAVELILSNVSLNDFELNPISLKEAGGEIFRHGASNFSDGSIMHNKFAIIDFKTVITGSFNWTNQAKRNEENIVIIEDTGQAEIFVEKFEALKSNSTILSSSGEKEEEGVVALSFTSTRNLVDPGQLFKLYWEAPNADQVRIDDEIVTVPQKGHREISIHRDTYFNIEASGHGEIRRKSLLVRVIKETSLNFHLSYLDPGSGIPTKLSPSNPLLDSYSAINGMNLTLSWEATNAESVRIDGEEVNPDKGSFSFTCVQRSITIEAFGVKDSVRKSISINAIPLPKLDRVVSPLPGDIQIYAEFDFLKIDVPASFTISGNLLSFIFPRLRQLRSRLVKPGFKIKSGPKESRTDRQFFRSNTPEKQRLRESLLSRFKDDHKTFSLLEKLLKRYE